MRDAFRTLYSQGGIPRFYKGLLPALFQALFSARKCCLPILLSLVSNLPVASASNNCGVSHIRRRGRAGCLEKCGNTALRVVWRREQMQST